MHNPGCELFAKENLRPYSLELPELEPGGILLYVVPCAIW